LDFFIAIIPRCDDWFHTDCLGLEPNEIYEYEKFYCKSCLEDNRFLSCLKLKEKPRLCKNGSCSLVSGNNSKYCSLNCVLSNSLMLAYKLVGENRQKSSEGPFSEEQNKLGLQENNHRLQMRRVKWNLECGLDSCHSNFSLAKSGRSEHDSTLDCILCGYTASISLWHCHYKKCYRKALRVQVEDSLPNPLVHDNLQQRFCGQETHLIKKGKCCLLKRSCLIHNAFKVCC
jgi:hypothetical protein